MRKYQRNIPHNIEELPYDGRREIMHQANLFWDINENIAYYHDHKEIGGELYEFLGVTEELLTLWEEKKLSTESLQFVMRKGRI